VITAVQPSLFGEIAINGRDATFADAKNEAIHSWFPYLEGFGAAFVEATFAKYMPDARKVIDPFAGTGTTPVALTQLGVATGYCEINPVMRLVVSAKLRALGLNVTARRKLLDILRDLGHQLESRVDQAEADPTLADDYARCFGKSLFFDEDVFGEVLRFRTVCDATRASNELAGDLMSIAVAAHLVSCSRLKRAGDVRYKTKNELVRGIPALMPSVLTQLNSMIRDLDRMHSCDAHAQLLAADAKDLGGAPSYAADGVITSPPYLNGTNYIRNTKLELWFLRFIASGSDLRELRDDVVTSGINDVTSGTASVACIDAAEAVLRELRSSAYDARIPRMVAGYFHDMQAVLHGLWLQVRPTATVCIDIGDSRYAGVHVPTPDILVAIANEIGFEHVETVPLRKRLSKDKSPLCQVLLVFRRGHDKANSSFSPNHRERWRWFAGNTPHQQPPYTKRNWGHPLHSACSYNGKMKPSLAHFLVHCFSEPGQSVLDPFAGAGTIPFEAALQGRQTLGFDISTMGLAITSAKIRPPERENLNNLLHRLQSFIGQAMISSDEFERAAAIRFNSAIPEYFHPDTLREVLLARRFFLEARDDSPEWCFALTCMLHVLHGNRPYALSRRSHPVTPFAPTGDTEYKSVLDKVHQKVVRSLETPCPPEFIAGHAFQADICAPWPEGCAGVDCIITSPPFFDSTRFYMTNWMRYWFCGWERDDFDAQASQFIETLQRQSLRIYHLIFARFAENLRPGGIAVVHLGRSKKCDMGSELAAIAADHLRVTDILSEDVTHCEKHGLSDKGTVTDHQYLILENR